MSSVNLDEGIMMIVRHLKNDLHCSDKEVLYRAVRLLHIANEAKSAGGELVICVNGKEQKVVIG